MENFEKSSQGSNNEHSQENYKLLLERAHNATTEEEAVSIACEMVDFNLALNRAPSIFVADLTGEGPESKEAAEKTLAIAEKVKSIYEDKGYSVDIERDPADFREFDLDIKEK